MMAESFQKHQGFYESKSLKNIQSKTGSFAVLKIKYLRNSLSFLSFFANVFANALKKFFSKLDCLPPPHHSLTTPQFGQTPNCGCNNLKPKAYSHSFRQVLTSFWMSMLCDPKLFWFEIPCDDLQHSRRNNVKRKTVLITVNWMQAHLVAIFDHSRIQFQIICLILSSTFSWDETS